MYRYAHGHMHTPCMHTHVCTYTVCTHTPKREKQKVKTSGKKSNHVSSHTPAHRELIRSLKPADTTENDEQETINLL